MPSCLDPPNTAWTMDRFDWNSDNRLVGVMLAMESSATSLPRACDVITRFGILLRTRTDAAIQPC